MRHALIIAGGSGTRLWPMSRARLPKQLIPFIGGKSLLQLAFDRLEGLVPASNRYICAGRGHADVIAAALDGSSSQGEQASRLFGSKPSQGTPTQERGRPARIASEAGKMPALPCGAPAARFSPEQFLGEPIGRDTLNAVGFSAAAIAARDPEAVIAVFTADHIIEPVDQFLKIVEHGFRLAEEASPTLVTFGIAPTAAATGYGYLELGDAIDDSARVVRQFREKPDAGTAGTYFAAGAERYLWNSGMFVWRASTLLDCIRRYEPQNFAGIEKIGAVWNTPQRESVLAEIFPALKKISVDFAVMEPASRDPQVRVAAVPMPLQWLDVGSWPMFAETCPRDADGNAVGGGRNTLLDTRRTLVASSDPNHLITTIGCEDLIIIHTPDATLVCHADQAENIKALHKRVGEDHGQELL